MSRFIGLLCLLLIAFSGVVYAQDEAVDVAVETAVEAVADVAPAPSNQTIPLWTEKVPGKLESDEKEWPALTLYLLPEGVGNGSAVVICPGGGYGHLAMDHEGHQVARWLNKLGVAGIILQYRHAPNYHHPIPMQDALRAMRTVRSRSAEWNIDPKKIGIIGFSAGGHLASTVGTHFDEGNKMSKDPIETVSSRPDFMILGYPVITFNNDYHHGGSMRNLIGKNPDPKLVEYYSNHLQISPYTPPTFLVHSSDDKVVPVENSLMFFKELSRFSIPAEMHIYQYGGHGFGLGPKDPVLNSWTKRCEDWMRYLGFLTK